MAIYHCSIKIVSRGKGKSAVAAAAYRAGETITNEYDGITHDYTRKGGIAHTEILLPDNAPREYADREILWNAVERVEKNKNSQLARDIEVALPKELQMWQNVALVQDYVKRNFVSVGMCADVCIHDKNDGNPHAHILLTMRPFEKDGSWGAKSKKEYILDDNGERIKLKSGEFKSQKVCVNDWNEQTKAEEWREAWAESVNFFLARQGMEEQVDHRSYERQGIDKAPTVHLGVAASQMEERGIKTERGDMNREINFINQQLRQLMEQIRKLKDWLKEELKNFVRPIAEVIQNIPQKKSYEKMSIKERLEFHKEESKEIKKAEPHTLDELYTRLNRALENVKYYDMRKKKAKSLDEWDSLNVKRIKAYNEYSSLKSEVKKAEEQALKRPARSKNNYER